MQEKACDSSAEPFRLAGGVAKYSVYQSGYQAAKGKSPSNNSNECHSHRISLARERKQRSATRGLQTNACKCSCIPQPAETELLPATHHHQPPGRQRCSRHDIPQYFQATRKVCPRYDQADPPSSLNFHRPPRGSKYKLNLTTHRDPIGW